MKANSKMAPLFMALVAISLLTESVVAQIMDPKPFGATTTGAPTSGGTVNGISTVSRIMNPLGICASFDGTPATVEGMKGISSLLLGSTGSFRAYDRVDTYTSTVFGVPSDNNNKEGPFATARLNQAYGCTRFADTQTGNGAVYYVTSDNRVRWMKDGVVYFDVPGTINSGGTQTAFVAVTVYNNYLYLLAQLSFDVYRCTISTANPQPSGCAKLGISTTGIGGKTQGGIAVTPEGVFIANANGLYWFNNDNVKVASYTDVPIVDVVYLPENGELFAISFTGVYQIFPETHANSNDKTIRTVLIGGEHSEYVNCPSIAQLNIDGENPTYCGMYKMHAVSRTEIYFTIPALQAVRSLTFPPVIVPLTFFRRPFPIGMLEAEQSMANLYSLIDHVLDGALNSEGGVLVNESSGEVDDDWWSTGVSIQVPQRNFDVTTTLPTVREANYGPVLAALEAYYAETDEVVYSDTNLLPTCDVVRMHNLERAIAMKAREALDYDIIYADRAVTRTINGNPNITSVKLLLPAPFNTEEVSNTLAATDFSKLIMETMMTEYSASERSQLQFSNDKYDFAKLDDEALMEVRWMIQRMITDGLADCAEMVGEPTGPIINKEPIGPSVEDGQTSGLIPFCESRIGISNHSTVEEVGQSGLFTQYDVFVPSSAFPYTFDVDYCINIEIDWTELEWWVNNHTVTAPSKRKCGTGCIIGIAVAAAVVVAILIIVIVVLTSKRRRLASAVVPASKPEFASTIDDDSDSLNRNPLYSSANV